MMPPILSETQKIVSAAKHAALLLLQDAHSAVEKLLVIAAGDEKTLLTRAEVAAIPIILDTIPPSYRTIVAPFVTIGASKVEGPLDTAVDALVTTGLGLAHSWLEGVLMRATQVLT
jgi:hypothetical protein